VPAAVANSQGLPISPDPAPSWLTKADDLVVDLPKSTTGGRKMLLAQTVLMNKNNVWGDASAGDRVTRPRWLRACLASNRVHTATHGHAHILRTRETLEIPQREQAKCAKKSDEAKCLRSAAHETFNWEKHRMMLEYLGSPENFSHVMVLDADAALVHHAHDTMSIMAAELAAAGKDFLLTNEDWMGPGAGASRINGGMLFAANTPFTKALFEDMLDAHLLEEGNQQPRLGGALLKCHSNEQLCLNALQKRPAFASRTLLTSGIRFNRGGCVLTRCGNGKGDPDLQMKSAGLRDPTLEIMHFVGNSKYVAPRAMCEEGHDLTGGGPDGYGCAE